ncbi:molybdopterin-dependent oxidoreductase [Methanogenium marinum]|uniref:Molybdopterin-dependent oxidoreductase n=1 Tax=Methanogenium marinum TaxID=348610 RepID=A0A9Q4KQL4_9EURY|nr:molybdopterin-dependent oxidoreductase [Methanogenium marinum]MDE4908510.1 molybdopterin-dependent oxidoreductase [Methanogenium marinum]
MKRFIPILCLCLLATACICGCTGNADPVVTDPSATDILPGNLTIKNGDLEVVLDGDMIRDLPAFVGYGYAVSTVGIKYGPYGVKGVRLTDLIAVVGEFGLENQVWVSAPDGYLWVFDYDQALGEGFITFDANLKEVPAPPLTIIIMYEQDGMPLTNEDGGPFRMVVATDTPDVITEGSSWVKWVDTIEIK